MKRIKTLFSAAFLLICNFSFAQETISVNVVYEFKYVRDLDNKDNPYTADMILSLGKHTSRFCAQRLYDENSKEARLEKEKQNTQQNKSPMPMVVVSGSPLLIVNKYGALINEEILKDRAKQNLSLFSHFGFKTYRIESALPEINWVVKDEKKTIGGYACQKAIGDYGGRTYEAWFTPDLPCQDGPWKLSGLPGLILEASDSLHEVIFTFKEITKNTDAEETTQSFLKDDRCIKTNLKAYNRTKAAFEEDPESFSTAMFPNAKLSIKNIDDPNATHTIKIKKYNPMELD
ncbi:GLPGLI family protein [Parafilimonas sp.]|uniref:GLPGLI family protein n=1 Tax=Parafilimonas sp. TaxID=1969739 RepID=UPI0039E2CCE8